MSEPITPYSLAVGDLDRELATTRRMLERVPDDHLAWKPHEKSMSLGALVAHLANLLTWQTMTIEHDGFDFAASPPSRDEPARMEDVLRTFDENAEALQEALQGFDTEAMAEPWTLRHGAHVIFSMPKAVVLRSFGISHLIHHRGQLSVYLRLLDVPVPGAYGPSADEG